MRPLAVRKPARHPKDYATLRETSTRSDSNDIVQREMLDIEIEDLRI